MSSASSPHCDDEASAPPPPNPEESANLFSRIFMLWLNPLVKKGYSSRLEVSDALKLNKRDDPLRHHTIFMGHYATNPSVYYAVKKTFGRSFLLAVVGSTIGNFSSIAGPLVLRSLLNYIQDCHKPEPPSAVYGVCLVALMFVSQIVDTVLKANALYVGKVVGKVFWGLAWPDLA